MVATTTGTTVIGTLDVDDTIYFIDQAGNGGGAIGSFKVDGSGLAKEASANYTIEDGGATVKLRTYAMTTWQLFDGVLDPNLQTGVLGQGHKLGNPQYNIVPAGSQVLFDGYFWPPSVRYDPYFMIDLDGVPSTTVLTNPDGRMSVGIHVAGGGGGAYVTAEKPAGLHHRRHGRHLCGGDGGWSSRRRRVARDLDGDEPGFRAGDGQRLG